jgi:heme/copper-type cytochrome/quinol oxidase subunit 3
MSAPRTVAGDLSALPDHAFGPAGMGWWGVFGFMLIEGMGFVLALAVYFYLMPFETAWPASAPPPPLGWSTAFTVLALLSEIPNVWLARAARRYDLRQVRVGLWLMVALGLLLVGVRFAEFDAMNIRWDRNAYGSIVWALLALHAFHTITDLYDSGVLAVLSVVRPFDGRKFADVTDNVLYWHFIVLSWCVIYAVVYWVPRWA